MAERLAISRRSCKLSVSYYILPLYSTSQVNNCRMDSTSSGVKRKKKVPTCPNPLFLYWLSQWYEEAASRELKTKFTYGKVSETHMYMAITLLQSFHLHGVIVSMVIVRKLL